MGVMFPSTQSNNLRVHSFQVGGGSTPEVQLQLCDLTATKFSSTSALTSNQDEYTSTQTNRQLYSQ